MNSQIDIERPTVLVVDDTPDNLSLLGDLLKEEYKVKVANNGEKALAIVRSETPPDLILLDIIMPGMDGYEVCHQLKTDAATSQIPIIFLTVRADMEDEKKGLEMGAVDYITKPISPPIVLARIRTQLRLKDVADILRNKNDFLEKEVKRRTSQVMEANQFNQQIITCVQEGIVVYDRDLRYLVWNPFMEKLTGKSASEVVGKHPLQLFPFLNDMGLMADLEKALSGETVPGCEHPHTIAATGRTGWTYNSTAPLRNTTGEIIGVIRVIRDITNQKLIEEQLRQSQKMEVVGKLAGGLAHDFNNILSVIMGCGYILQTDNTLNDKQKENIEHILSAAERAAQLTRGLLTFSRKQVVIPKLENLNNIAMHIQKFLVRLLGEEIHIRLILSKEPLPVIVDNGQVEQILINLATNARDAMPQGGILSIETGIREVAASLVPAHGHSEPGFYACVEVSDNGCGMDQATRDKIFEPFFTTKEIDKGTGLGMTIISGIVQQHKGFVTVDSEPGHGSTFRIYFPLIVIEQAAHEEKAAQAMYEEKKAPATLRGGCETILLAEDDAGVRNLIVTLLTEFGYVVIQARGGQEAVEKFVENRDKINLILMDMIMPGKDGQEASEEIRRLSPGTRIIYTSVNTTDFIRNLGVDGQEISIIAKPVQPQELLRKVRETLDA
ncbi:MAG: response regulator [Candidatus Ozemobacteraceae bacterium]